MSTIHVPSVIKEGEVFSIEDWKGMVVIPQNLVVKGGLHLINCDNVSSFYEETYILGDLTLQNCNVKRLPKYLFVGGNLMLTGIWCEEMPEVFNIRGNLFARGVSWFKENRCRYWVGGKEYL